MLRLVAFISFVICMMPGLALAQVRWFSPTDFDMTCRIDERCVVGQACEPVSEQFTIRHAPTEAQTAFEMPDGAAMTGAVAVMATELGHTLIATASADGRIVYRLVAYTNARVTILKTHDDRPDQDEVYYGQCNDVLTGHPNRVNG